MSRRPQVLYGLITLNMLSYAVTMLGEDKLSFLAQAGFVPTQHLPLTWLAYPFLHLDHYHLIINTAFFYLIGGGVEDVLGRARFLLLYLLSGLGAAGLYLALTPPHLGGIPLLGAAGAISGMFGAFLVLLPKRQTAIFILLIVWPIRLFRSNGWWFILLWFGYQLTLTAMGPFGPWQIRTIPWALTGGLLTGAFLAWIFVRFGVPRETEPPTPLPIPESNSMTLQAWGFIGIYLIFAIVSAMTLPVQLARPWEPSPFAPAGPVPLSHQPLTLATAPALRLLAQWDTGLQPARAALSADGHSLVLWEEERLSFWDTQTGTQLATHERPLGRATMTFTSENTLLLVGESSDGLQRIEWEPSGTQRRVVALPDREGDDAFSLSPDGQWIAVYVSGDGPEVWRTENGEVIANLGLTGGLQHYFDDWSADGRVLAVGNTWRKEKTLHLWQFPEAQRMREISLGENLEVVDLAISPDGEYIALTTDKGGLEVWGSDGTRRYATRLPKDERPNDLLFNPDGTLLATATATGDILVIEASSGAPVAFLFHPLYRDGVERPNFVLDLAFTDDGRLVSVDYEGLVRWWGIPTP